MKRLALCISLAALPHTAAVLVLLPTQATRAEDNKTHSRKKQNPEQYSATTLPSEGNTDVRDHDAKNSTTYAATQNDAWIKWGVIVNGALVVVSAAIAGFTGLQARAAKRSADDADRTVRLTQRADVLLECIEMINDQPFGHDTSVTLHFKELWANSGQ